MLDKHKFVRKTHYGQPRDHQCTVCKGMYETVDAMNNHVCNFSLENIEKFGENRCDICDVKFERRDLLQSHNLTFHVTEKNFACDQCDFNVSFIAFHL